MIRLAIEVLLQRRYNGGFADQLDQIVHEAGAHEVTMSDRGDATQHRLRQPAVRSRQAGGLCRSEMAGEWLKRACVHVGPLLTAVVM